MDAIEYLPWAIRLALANLDLPVAQVRFADLSETEGRTSVVWRIIPPPASLSYDAPQYSNLLDGPTDGIQQYFEIECRVHESVPEAARQNADRIIDFLHGRELLNALTARYDKPDDASGQSGKYVAHVIEIGMPNLVDEPDEPFIHRKSDFTVLVESEVGPPLVIRPRRGYSGPPDVIPSIFATAEVDVQVEGTSNPPDVFKGSTLAQFDIDVEYRSLP